MQHPIFRRDKAGRNEQWILDIAPEVTTLVRPVGQPLAQWSPQQVAESVQFPSFSKSIKYVGFRTTSGMYEFDVKGQALQELRAFGNRGIAAKGPAAVAAVLRTAILTLVLGLLLCAFGIFSLFRTVSEMTGNSQSTSSHPVGAASTIVGLAVACRGIYGFYQYSQLKGMSTPSK